MDTLRVVLIIIGVLILVAIYLYSARKRRNAKFEMSDSFAGNDLYRSDPPPIGKLAAANKPNRESEPDNIGEQLSQLGGMISQYKSKTASRSQQEIPTLTKSRDNAKVYDAALSGSNESHIPELNVRVAGKSPRHAPRHEPPSRNTPPVDQPDIDHEEVQQEDFSGRDKFPQVIILNVLASHGRLFQGTDILNALHAAGMEFGDMGIFHRFTLASGRRRPVFSLANMIEPGSFDYEDMAAFSTSGLTFFMQLPAPIDNLDAYEDMLLMAHSIAELLDGDVCDERRNILTLQAIDYTRELLREFTHKLMVARKRAEQQH